MKHFIVALGLLCGAGQLGGAATVTLRASGAWAVATNWTPATVPGLSDDAVVNGQRYADVFTNVGPVKTLTLGNVSGEGALNVQAGSSLSISNGSGVCVVVSGPGAAGTQIAPFPSFYSHIDGGFTTTGDMVIGTNELSGEAFFNKGTLRVGGALRIGAQTAGVSQFKVNGAGQGFGATLGAQRLELGGRGRLVFDYLGGAAVMPISVSNQFNLAPDSALVLTNMGAVPAGTWTLVDAGSISGTFGSVKLFGLPAASSAEIRYDTGNGNVLLVVSNAITEFDNFVGDFAWTTTENWLPTYPVSDSAARLLAAVSIDSEVNVGYLETGSLSVNSALNINAGGSLVLSRPGVSMVVGVVSNSSGAPNYYAHNAGTLNAVGDLILGANGGRAEAIFSSGEISVGGLLSIGSYQSAGPSALKLRGGGGSISANYAQIGSNGKLTFDFIGGTSLKTITAANSITLASGSKLCITNNSSNPASLVAANYTLLQGAYVSGTFSQVEFFGFPETLRPHIAYSGTSVRLVVEPVQPGAPYVDDGTYRLNGYNRVVPSGAADWSFGTAAEGEDIYHTENIAGTIMKTAGGVSSVVRSNLDGIYGLALRGDKMYFGREFGNTPGTAKIFEMTRSNSVWGAPREVASGLTRPRQLFVEATGHILAAVETGQILRINPTNNAVTTLVSGLYAPQAAVSDSAGNLYFNEYGSTSGDGTPTVTGKLWKLPVGSSVMTKLWEGERLRGLAFVPGGEERLVQLTEANREDQGSSSTTAILSTSGALLDTISGVDYPQFTGVTASGAVVTTCPRDQSLVSIISGVATGSDAPVALRNGIDCVATVKGWAYRTNGADRIPVTLNGMSGGPLTFYITPDSGGNFAGWVRTVKSEWPDVSTNELLTHGYPGYFAVPKPSIQSSGNLKRLQVLAHRSRNISRWPMTNVGTANEAPQPGFSEAPDAYLAYFEISQLSVNPPVSVWDAGGGTDYGWANAANWSTDVLPGAGDDVLLKGTVQVTSAAGPVINIVGGNATNNVSLNMIYPGSLTANSLTIGSADNPESYPNYFYGNGGTIATAGDLVIGARGAKIEGTYTWGDINVGAALKIGSGYASANSSLVLRGASGAINSGSLVIGGGVQLVFDFIGGTAMRTLIATNGTTLETGSSLKVVGNANTVAGTNRRLIDGGANQLTGTFTVVDFEGFPSNVAPRIEYNANDGDVWLVVDAIPSPASPYSIWAGSTSPPNATSLLKYAIGGAPGPNAAGESAQHTVDGAKLYLSAVVRTNDQNLMVVGQSALSLPGVWSDLAVNPLGVPSGDTSNVPDGCQRRVYSVDRGTNSKLFLRLRATLP